MCQVLRKKLKSYEHFFFSKSNRKQVKVNMVTVFSLQSRACNFHRDIQFAVDIAHGEPGVVYQTLGSRA